MQNIVVASNTRIGWKRDGVLHRTDGPAVITQQGWAYWYNEGELFYSETRFTSALRKLKCCTK